MQYEHCEEIATPTAMSSRFSGSIAPSCRPMLPANVA
jgi:hypothetical protein